MATATITLIDIEGKPGRLGMKVHPPLLELVAKQKSGHGLSLAEEKVLLMANAIAYIGLEKDKKAAEERLQVMAQIR